MKDIEDERNETRREKEERLLEQFYKVYGNLQCLNGILTVVADGFRDHKSQMAIQVFDGTNYFLEHVLKELGQTVGEYDLMLLHSK